MAFSNSCEISSFSERLFNAVKDENFKIVQEILLSTKSSILSYSDWAGHTALHMSSINGNCAIAKTLVRHGANLNACSRMKKTPLHFASQNGHSEIVDFLITCGSNINSQDSLEMTPLHWAVEKNHCDIVQIICNNKEIDLNIKDKFDRTCMSIALSNKNDKIVKIIENAIKERKDTTLNDLQKFEKRLEKSSTKSNRSFNALAESLNLNEEEEERLNEFYKNKSFAKALSSKSNRSFDVFKNNQSKTVNIHSSRPSLISNFSKNDPRNTVNNDLEDEDSVDYDDFNFISDSSKKTKLSYSPISNVEDTLNWLKNQSNSTNKKSLENCELSLTEAGLKTLEYLNRSDPIRDEQSMEDKFDQEQKEKTISTPSSPISETNLELINSIKQYEVNENLALLKKL